MGEARGNNDQCALVDHGLYSFGNGFDGVLIHFPLGIAQIAHQDGHQLEFKEALLQVGEHGFDGELIFVNALSRFLEPVIHLMGMKQGRKQQAPHGGGIQGNRPQRGEKEVHGGNGTVFKHGAVAGRDDNHPFILPRLQGFERMGADPARQFIGRG
ncbi:MAG: hypothetical protein BWX80_04001 [Candidatus Hydrogenedentes bacterium ADurb.Bin101]|nr:MAG: hypothetical protein BWX80_04001 [Candidatus Hydrogenedentes bacterium ADurb.Bin101]